MQTIHILKNSGKRVIWHRQRARPSLPLAAFAVVAVVALFLSVAPQAKDKAQIATPIVSEAATHSIKTDMHPLQPAREEPPPYTPNEAEVEMLARTIWGEARGIPSDMEKAAVAWCVLNRVDGGKWPDTVAEVVTQPNQFIGYSSTYPATEELKAIAADVLTRWELEKQSGGDVGRVLPKEYTFFTGDGKNNHFRTEYRGGTRWDWTSKNPYSS